MTDNKVTAERLLGILDKLFIVPDDSHKRMVTSGMTSRQATAIDLFSQGKSISEIAEVITNGSSFTQNAYDALGVGISKIFEALVLVKELSENKILIGEILKRGLNYKRRFNLEYK